MIGMRQLIERILIFVKASKPLQALIVFPLLIWYLTKIPAMMAWSKKYSEFQYIRAHPEYLHEHPEYLIEHPDCC